MNELAQKLQAPFPESDIEWRIGRCGGSAGDVWAKCLAYITARAVMDRLDEVVGPEDWQDDYTFLPNGVMCKLSLRICNGAGSVDWVSKVNGSDPTDMEAFKGAISKALVRAATNWGIGRYLYNLGESYAETKKTTKDDNWGKTKEGVQFYWKPPKLPAWAVPEKKTTGTPNTNSAPPATPAEIRKLYDATKAAGYDKAWLIRECAKSFDTSDPTKLHSDEVKEILDFLESKAKPV